jgi:hypothetical protein
VKQQLAGLFCALAGLTLPVAAQSAEEDDATHLLALVQRGDLAAAEVALPSLTEDAVRDRIGVLVAARRALGTQLVQQARRDLAEARLTAALRRLDLALTIDRSLAATPEARTVQEHRQVHDQALAALSVCARRREPLCLRDALARVREHDRHNAFALQIELQSADWYRLPAANAARGVPDAPTSSR